jgi:DNA mismatch endonuclease (patch repair protein)
MAAKDIDSRTCSGGAIGRQVETPARVLPPEEMTPSSPSVSRRMSAAARAHTAPERALRSALHRRGLRFRIQCPLPFDRRRKADISFPRETVAVFVDGCFWHSCPEHATHPKANADFWRVKLERNRERDADTDRRLADAGWSVIRIWEHEDPETAADRVATAVIERRRSSVRRRAGAA